MSFWDSVIGSVPNPYKAFKEKFNAGDDVYVVRGSIGTCPLKTGPKKEDWHRLNVDNLADVTVGQTWECPHGGVGMLRADGYHWAWDDYGVRAFYSRAGDLYYWDKTGSYKNGALRTSQEPPPAPPGIVWVMPSDEVISEWEREREVSQREVSEFEKSEVSTGGLLAVGLFGLVVVGGAFFAAKYAKKTRKKKRRR